MKRRNSFPSMIAMFICLLIVSIPFAYADCVAEVSDNIQPERGLTNDQADAWIAALRENVIRRDFTAPLTELGLSNNQIKKIAELEIEGHSELVSGIFDAIEVVPKLDKVGDIIGEPLSLGNLISNEQQYETEPDVRSAEVAVAYDPLSTVRGTKVGGDHYFAEESGGVIRAGIFDIRNHGAIAAVGKYALTGYIEAGKGRPFGDFVSDLGSQMGSMHTQVLKARMMGDFAQASVLEIDTRTNTLRYTNYGNKFFIARATGEIEFIQDRAPVLGMARKSPVSEQTLNPGDKVILFSDGVTESIRGEVEFLGEEGLQNIIRANSHLDAAGLQNAIINSMQQQGFAADDDVTLMVIEATPAVSAQQISTGVTAQPDGSVRVSDSLVTDVSQQTGLSEQNLAREVEQRTAADDRCGGGSIACSIRPGDPTPPGVHEAQVENALGDIAVEVTPAVAADTIGSQVVAALVDAGHTEALETDFENKLAQKGISYASLVEAQKMGKLESLAPDFFQSPNKYLADPKFWGTLQGSLMQSIGSISNDRGVPDLDTSFKSIQLTSGAYGEAHIVKTADGRYLIRKRLHTPNSRSRAEFKREARILDYASRLGQNIPGLVKIQGIELTADGRNVDAIYTELVGDIESYQQGHVKTEQDPISMKDLFYQNKIKVSQKAWQDFRAMIKFLNTNGILHKDIKNPNNIIYDPATETLKLIDFGISDGPEETAGQARDSEGVIVTRSSYGQVMEVDSDYYNSHPYYLQEISEMQLVDLMSAALVNANLIEAAPAVVEEVAPEPAVTPEAEVPAVEEAPAAEARVPAPTLGPVAQANVQMLENNLANAIQDSGQRVAAFINFHIDKDTGQILGIGENTPASIKSAVNVEAAAVKIDIEGLDLATLTFDQIKQRITAPNLENRPEFTQEASNNFADAIDAVKAEVPAAVGGIPGISTDIVNDLVQDIVGC